VIHNNDVPIQAKERLYQEWRLKVNMCVQGQQLFLQFYHFAEYSLLLYNINCPLNFFESLLHTATTVIKSGRVKLLVYGN